MTNGGHPDGAARGVDGRERGVSVPREVVLGVRERELGRDAGRRA
jgi:hypothetical protein